MDYPGTIDFIYGLQRHGVKLGLQRISHLLELLGNPHYSYPSIHIAGTNGKGSVSAIISSILTEAGFKTGLFTSPHLLSFTERIRIGYSCITEEEVVNYASRLRSIIEANGIKGTTFFEFVTAMAMLYFAQRAVDCAVFETGMGGRLDATNVINPEVSVITKIGYDHREFLGDTLEQIAYEKAGIIKAKTPLVCASQHQEALGVIIKRAEGLDARCYLFGRDFSASLLKASYKGIGFDFVSEGLYLNDLSLPLAGVHQLENASLAIMASYLFVRKRSKKGQITSAIKEGISGVRWEGRLQLLSLSPQILIDGAHNPEASGALASFINTYLHGQRIIFVIAIMADKDVVGILRHLLPIGERIIFTAPKSDRAAPPARLLDTARSMGLKNTLCAATVKEALDLAFSFTGHNLSGFRCPRYYQRDLDINPNEPLIVITGSFYLLGEVLEILGFKPVLGDLRETMRV
jgi:dihydrofolate synthase/folylpolyglutamate synthase